MNPELFVIKDYDCMPIALIIQNLTRKLHNLMTKQTSDIGNLWWLIPGKLAGMSRPQLADLPELRQIGIQGIVSVMDEPSGIKEYKQEGFQALWLPITGGKPPSVEQVKQFVNFAEPIIGDNHSVVVHCTSGKRRTGTLLAAYLIAKGENPQQAISLTAWLRYALIQKARPTAELREAQQNFLLQLPELLAN